jgi:hypothetical protein
MAKKEYSSIIDAFLSDREPDWKDLGLKDAVKSGETQLKRTHDHIDGDILEEIAESASHHSMLPAGGKGGKKKLVSSVPDDWSGRSKNAMNEDSILGEALHDIESMKDNSDGMKKKLTDAEVTGRIDKILGSGLTAAAKVAALKKLGEIELFNKGMATDYLNRTAPNLGINYLEPNTYMDKSSPTYERETPNVASGDKHSDECVANNERSATEVCICGLDPEHPAGVKTSVQTPQIPALPGSTPLGISGKPKHTHDLGRPHDGTCPACGQGSISQPGIKMMSSYKFTPTKIVAANILAFSHESDGTSIKISAKTNSWQQVGMGGSVKTAGTGLKSLLVLLQKKYGRGLPVQAGQRTAGGSNEPVCINCSKTVSLQDVMKKKQERKYSSSIPIIRNAENKSSKTASQVAYATANDFDSGDIERLRVAGQALSYIYKFATTKVGEHVAAKAMSAWLSGKKKGGEIILPAGDVEFLRDKLGFKGARVEKNIAKAAGIRHKIAANAPIDGHSILAEFDLKEKKTVDINTDGCTLENVEVNPIFSIEV